MLQLRCDPCNNGGSGNFGTPSSMDRVEEKKIQAPKAGHESRVSSALRLYSTRDPIPGDMIQIQPPSTGRGG
jgi:hypothetical protein